MSDSLDARIAELEVKFAFQQEALDSLSDTVTAQWTEIDRLKRHLELFRDKLEEMADNPGDPKTEPRPPHY